jgi:hypothetical protein
VARDPGRNGAGLCEVLEAKERSAAARGIIAFKPREWKHGEVSMALRKLWLVNAPSVLALVLNLSGCSDSPPAVGSHLPGTFAVASDAFDQRIKDRYKEVCL